MKRRPRVLLYSDASACAGGEAYLLALARGLPKDELDIEAVTGTASGTDALARDLLEAGIAVKRLPPVARLSETRSFLQVLGFFARNRPQVLHFNLVDPRACNGAMAAAAATGQGGFVVTEHLPQSPFDDKPLPFRHRLAARRTAVTIVNSRDHERVVEERLHNRSRVVVIPNGLADPGAPDAARRAAARAAMGIDGAPGSVIGFVARLEAQKNPMLFIEGLRRVAPARPDVRFVVIGEGELRAAMEAKLEEIGLSSAVSFLGWREDARKLMYGLDLLVNTSLYEGQPITILEAALRGVPVCAQRIAGMEEFVADRAAGRVIAPQDGDALGQALLELAASPEALQRMGRVARERTLLLFSLESMCRRTADLYLDLAG